MSESANTRTTVAVISVRWASAFQQQVGEKALREILRAWQDFCLEKHRRNVIKIDIGESAPKNPYHSRRGQPPLPAL